MTYDSQKYHRRSIRLTGYDYSQAGAYFITVCVQDRACLFGDVAGGQMHLNDAGRLVLAEWDTLPVRFPTVELDEFGVMPNHVHGIIVIATAGRNTNAGVNGNGGTEPTEQATESAGFVFVGAGLVPAPGAAVVTGPGATTRVAPTSAAGIGPNERTTGGMGPTEQATELAGFVGAGLVPAPLAVAPVPPPTLGDIVGAFKSLTTDLYIHGVKQSGWPPFRGRLWQRNYYEHIIRDDRSLNRIRQYILDNPAHWASDLENPQAERPEKKKA